MRKFTTNSKQKWALFLLMAYMLPLLFLGLSPPTHATEGAVGSGPSLSFPQDQGDEDDEDTGDTDTGDTGDDQSQGDDDTGDTDTAPEQQQNTGASPEISLLTGGSNIYGMARIHLPDAINYTVTITVRFYQDGVQVYAPTLSDYNLHLNGGTIETPISFGIDDENGNKGFISYAKIDNLMGGKAYFIPNILTTSSTHYNSVEFEVTAYSFANSNAVSFPDGNKLTITPYFSAALTGDDLSYFSSKSYTNFRAVTDTTLRTNPTKDTFATVGGGYTIDNLFNNYNVISLTNFQGTHVIGPLVSVDYAARIGFDYVNKPYTSLAYTKGELIVNDYSNGVPSYIGQLYKSPGSSTVPAVPVVRVEYGVDINPNSGSTHYDKNFINNLPPLYTKLTGYSVFMAGELNDPRMYIAPTSGDTTVFVSPNSGGRNTQVYQNDSYIDPSTLTKLVTDASVHIHQHGVLSTEKSRASEIIKIDIATANPSINTNYVQYALDGDNVTLTLYYGNSYQIKNSGTNSNVLHTINFITKETSSGVASNFDYGTDYDTNPTTISFDASALPTGRRNDETKHNIFPKILVDGIALQVGQGYGGEFYDQGNKIIWNFPYTTGYISFRTVGENLPGHLIAPLADIRNYSGTGASSSSVTTWSGGNINGIMIANSIHGGNMEFHMWPYLTDTEREEFYNDTYLTVSGTKTTTTGYFVDGFQFDLEESSSNNTAGYTMPKDTTAISDDAGLFKFGNIGFKLDGTYKFTVTEVQSSTNYPYLGFSFDDNIYTITVVVGKDEVVTDTSTTTTYSVDSVTVTASDGSSPTQPTLDANDEYVTSQSIVFLNSYEVTELPETGGVGTSSYTVIALTMLGLAVCIYKKKYFYESER